MSPAEVIASKGSQMESDTEPDPETILKGIGESRGNFPTLPAFQVLANEDPAFMAAFDKVSRLTLFSDESHRRELSNLTRQLIAIALLASREDEIIREHLKRALDLGATRRQIIEALEVGLHITGAPTLRFGLDMLAEIEHASS